MAQLNKSLLVNRPNVIPYLFNRETLLKFEPIMKRATGLLSQSEMKKMKTVFKNLILNVK